MGVAKLLHTYRPQILALAKHHGAYNIRVFGSMARGDDNPTSDVDLLVNFEHSRSLWDHVALIQDLEGLLGRSVDVVSESAIHWFIRDRVLKEAVSL